MARAVRLLAWLSVGATALALAVVPREHAHVTTYASASSSLAAADLVAALTLGTACALGLLLDRRARPGLAAAGAAALAWTAADLIGWEGGPDLLRSAGAVATPFLVPLLLNVLVSAADVMSRVGRLLLATAYAGASIAAVVTALVGDPFLDEDCWANCSTNSFLVAAHPHLAHEVASTWRLLAVALASGIVLEIALRGHSPSGRRARGPAVVAAALAAAALAAVLGVEAAMRAAHPRVDPLTDRDATLYLATAAVVALVAGVWVLGPLRDAWVRRSVAGLVADLGSAAAAGTVARVLASATGDPGLRLLYRLPGSTAYVDAAGRSVATQPAGRDVTPILRQGRELALAVHDRDVDPDLVAQACGTALLLALDNERLRAAGLVHLDELRASRTRIVEAGDTERRQLERNLHDGAQQRMLAVTFDLRRAVAATADGPAPTAALVRAAEEEAQQGLAELRELAHGINPALLDEAGLASALWSLADTAPVPLELGALPTRRFAGGVERAAYVVVLEALDAARAAGADRLRVALTVQGADLVVEVRGAGPGPFVPVEDRVAGAGGYVEVGLGKLRAVIPCG